VILEPNATLAATIRSEIVGCEYCALEDGPFDVAHGHALDLDTLFDNHGVAEELRVGLANLVECGKCKARLSPYSTIATESVSRANVFTLYWRLPNGRR
jgi:hypothetical protein